MRYVSLIFLLDFEFLHFSDAAMSVFIFYFFIYQVLPSLRDKHDEFMLRELVKRWANHKVMVKWLSRFFYYLDRYFIARRSLPALNEVGLACFRELVCMSSYVSPHFLYLYGYKKPKLQQLLWAMIWTTAYVSIYLLSLLQNLFLSNSKIFFSDYRFTRRCTVESKML